MTGTDWRTALASDHESSEGGHRIVSSPRTLHFQGETAATLDVIIYPRSDGAFTFAPIHLPTEEWTRGLSEEQVDACLRQHGIDPTTGWH